MHWYSADFLGRGYQRCSCTPWWYRYRCAVSFDWTLLLQYPTRTRRQGVSYMLPKNPVCWRFSKNSIHRVPCLLPPCVPCRVPTRVLRGFEWLWSVLPSGSMQRWSSGFQRLSSLLSTCVVWNGWVLLGFKQLQSVLSQCFMWNLGILPGYKRLQSLLFGSRILFERFSNRFTRMQGLLHDSAMWEKMLMAPGGEIVGARDLSIGFNDRCWWMSSMLLSKMFRWNSVKMYYDIRFKGWTK